LLPPPFAMSRHSRCRHIDTLSAAGATLCHYCAITYLFALPLMLLSRAMSIRLIAMAPLMPRLRHLLSRHVMPHIIFMPPLPRRQSQS
jgi:hypothetical protein